MIGFIKIDFRHAPSKGQADPFADVHYVGLKPEFESSSFTGTIKKALVYSKRE
jgi:hypothetical protein